MSTSSRDARNNSSSNAQPNPPPPPPVPQAPSGPVYEEYIQRKRQMRLKIASSASLFSELKVEKAEINPKVAKVIAETGPNTSLVAADVYAPNLSPVVAPISAAATAALVKDITKKLSETNVRQKMREVKMQLPDNAGSSSGSGASSNNAVAIGSNAAASNEASAAEAASGASENSGAAKGARNALNKAKAAFNKAKEGARKVTEFKEKVERLKAVFDNKPALMNMLSETVLNQMVASGGMSQGQLNKIRVAVDGAVRTVDYADVKSTKGVFTLFGQVLGNNNVVSVIDEGGKTKVLRELFDFAIKLEVPEFIDKMVGKDPNDRATVNALNYTLNTAVWQGDVRTSKKIIDAIGVNKAKELMPNIIQQMILSYKLAPGVEKSQYQGLADEFKEFAQMLDNNWLYYNRNGEMVMRLEYFTHASIDFKKIAIFLPEIKHAILIAASYIYMPLQTLARRNYPYIAF